MNEAVEVGSYAENVYSKWERDELEAHGFHWVPGDKEWFNDKYRGNTTVSIHKDGADNHYVMLHTYYDWDGQYHEDYDHFKDLQDLIEELPRP